MKTAVTILGIDPALGTTGYGVIRAVGSQVQLVDAGIVQVPRDRPFESRLKELFDGVMEVIAQHAPQHFAMEQLYSHYERPRTAILMGHARGVICLAAAQAGVPVVSYEPTMVKKLLTGNGRAPKNQMQAAVQFQLRLAQPLEPPDIADALAIALSHLHALRMPALAPSSGRLSVLDQINALQLKTQKQSKVRKPG
ncbi:MAG: crossover junction endodeoxyribonuclease RuvC [Aureliella sp.]